MTNARVPSFRTQLQYVLLKLADYVVEKSVDESLLLIMRFLFAFKLLLKTTIRFAHRNDECTGSVISNTAAVCSS
jgi:hypothetical protein